MLHNDLGSLAQYFTSPQITEVMINNDTSVFVEDQTGMHYAGQLQTGELHAIVERILLPLGKRLDRTSPIVDARLSDGSRMCAVIPPVSPSGMNVSIRRFSPSVLTLNEFTNPAIAQLLIDAVAQKHNIMVSGKAGSGKTTLLAALCSHIATHERIITIEDVRELFLNNPNVVHLETRATSPEGVPGVSMTDLVRASLRLRPDRIVVGEIRGPEVVDMLTALTTGHAGSMSSCHANSAMHALQRIESLMLQHCPQWNRVTIHEHIGTALNLIIHVTRNQHGERFINEIIEVPPTHRDQPKVLFRA